MAIEVAEGPLTALSGYARVPITFTVDYVLDVTTGPMGLRNLHCQSAAAKFLVRRDGR
jgi:hypothetical protein